MRKLKKVLLSGTIAIGLMTASFNNIGSAAMNESISNNSFETATQIPSFYDFNERINASIETIGDQDYYVFTPKISGGYHILGYSDSEIYGYLYDSSKTNILDLGNHQEAGSNENFKFKLIGELTADNKYYIRVCNNSGGTGAYNLQIIPTIPDIERENNNTFDTANNFLYSQYNNSISSSIYPQSDIDIYSFTPETSGSYTIESTGNIDSSGRLYSAGNLVNALSLNDDDGENYNFKITYNLNADNKYYIRVASSINPNVQNCTDTYKLKITKNDIIGSDTEGNDFSSATNVINNKASGTISNFNDVDYFKFTATSTGIHTFKASGNCLIFAEICNSSYKMIAYNDYYENNIEVNCEAGKTYYIKVRTIWGTPGSYEFTVARGKCLPVINYNQQPYNWLCWASCSAMVTSYFNSDSINRTVPIAKSIHNGYYPSEFNKVVFGSSSAGQGVVQNILGLSYTAHDPVTNGQTGDSSMTTNAAVKLPYAWVKDYIQAGYPIIVNLSSNTSITGGGHAVVLKGFTEIAGIQYVILNDPWNGQESTIKYENLGVSSYTTFNYGTPVELSNDSLETATPVSSFGEITASIESPGDVDYYCFSTQGLTAVDIETIGTIDTIGELYKSKSANSISDMELLKADDDSGEGANFKITNILLGKTNYYIKVSHKSSTATGSYKLKIQPNLNYNYSVEGETAFITNNTFQDATILPANGTEIVSYINYAGDIDFYKLNITEPGNYVIETTGDAKTWGKLYNSNQHQILSDNESGINNNFKLVKYLQPGVYYTQVGDPNLEENGYYFIKAYKQ